jgi:preprotein translocase subunit SecA
LGIKTLDLKLSEHGYERILERITYMTYSEAEYFVQKEIEKSNITLLESLENGAEAVAYIYDDIKYIVQNQTIVTVYTLY